MKRLLLFFFGIVAAGLVASPAASATDIPLGIFSYNLTTPPGAAEFDITNFTGPNSSTYPDTTFPVSSTVNLSSLSLTVSFASGPSEVFGSSYFTLAPDGISFDGTALSTGVGQPNGLSGAVGAVLTGSLDSSTLTLNDGTTVTVSPSFTAAMSDSKGLADGDFGVLVAGTGAGPGTTPEPESLVMVGTGLAALAGFGRRRLRSRQVARALAAAPMVLVGLAVLGAPVTAFAATDSVKLNTWTTPSTGASGSTFVSVLGTGFPAGSISASSVTVSLSTSCSSIGVSYPTTAASVTPLVGTSDRVRFEIPALLDTGTYYVSVSGTSDGGVTFASNNCSEIQVTHTSTALAACLPTSSLAVLSGKNVTAYVPNGSWGTGTTGVKVVPIEGAGAAASITTASEVNSCSSNSQTGETVCVGNNTDVYTIMGTSLTSTLHSSASGYASFSGGECQNCGVAINALTNTAVISMGVTGSSSGDGVQVLNLANNTFAPVFPTDAAVSEDVSVDPNRNLILSPGEDNIYDILKISSTGALTEYEHAVSASGEMDSAAEDCTTGIALSTLEFTGNLYITDLTQATFTEPAGGVKHGTWTAPGQVVNFPEFDYFSAGTDGISVAAGTTHLGIVEGEFGGSSFGVFQLPATSGTGTPSFVDYAAANMPNTPDGVYFSAGYDPHTITAYTSPNDGKAYGLIADWARGTPDYIGVIDLQALLNAPRTAGTHNLDPSYNLLAHGVVRYIAIAP